MAKRKTTNDNHDRITVADCWKKARRFSRADRPLRIGPPYEDREYPLSEWFHHVKDSFWWSVSLWEGVGQDLARESLVQAVQLALAISEAKMVFAHDGYQKRSHEIQFYHKQWPLPDREVSCFRRPAVSAMEGASWFARWTFDRVCLGPSAIDFLEDQECEVWPESDPRVPLWHKGLVGIRDEELSGFTSVSQLRTERERVVCQMKSEYLRYQANANESGSDASADSGQERVYSQDYRSVNWYGEHYGFTAAQAETVKLLAEAFEAGIPDVDAALLVGEDAFTQEGLTNRGRKPSFAKRVRDVFRNNPAWGKIICPGDSKGTYRLVKPGS